MVDHVMCANADELNGFTLSDKELGQLKQGTDAAVMATMRPSTLLDEEDDTQTQDELTSLWTVALRESTRPQEKEDDLVRGELLDGDPTIEQASDGAISLFPSSVMASLIELQRVPIAREGTRGTKTKDRKSKRVLPCEAKARLRCYERRSRHKREHTIRIMKETVTAMESHIKSRCQDEQSDNLLKRKILELTMEAMYLTNHNYSLCKALDDHRFFHAMLQLEYDHRETTATEELFDLHTPRSWRPMEEVMYLRIMRDSLLEIEAFSNNDDLVSSGLEICGWREKRKLVGNSVNFMFHKTFAKNCSEDLAARSWEMRAVQDQVTRYFGHSLEVQIEVLQRFENDVVVVRRKMKHSVDGWVHHTIYLLFRVKTPDGHLVCIRDMNPEDTEDMHFMSEAVTMAPSVIWSKAFIWWKFTILPEVEGQRIHGFEVEYGGSLGSATQADAAFWMREVLVLALRWETLVVGPLITLG